MQSLRELFTTHENGVPFKQTKSFGDRRAAALQVLRAHPDRVPVVIERDPNASALTPRLRRPKYLVPRDMVVAQLVYRIRGWLDIDPSQAVFVYVNKQLAPSNSPMGALYLNHRDEDDMLYITYSLESTFG